MHTEEREALAQRARAVYEEEEERQRQARQAAQAAEEAERRQAERQAQERFGQALTVLEERLGLPAELCAWMHRHPGQPGGLCLQLYPPEPFGCAHCTWTLHPAAAAGDLAAQNWYVSCACERVPFSCNRAGWIEPERLRDLLLFRLEVSRRMHARWQELETEDQAARAELAERQAEVLARVCPWPKETPLTLYRVHYVRGAVLTEGGDCCWLTETGWSRSDQPDAEGYLRLEPTAGCPERRLLKLDPQLHRPMFEKLVLSSREQLPLELTETQEEQISGFQWQHYGDRDLLVRDPAGSVLSFFQVPLPWVRALLTQSEIGSENHHGPQS
ncbi:hypothetical protein [Thermogemmatispora tikiterensis]|uniref:Uncharacterized protein n=1 Tax=Thermogemmatispora tikiterensis TaxID=1825093 RepID=A0A328VHR7_9CHLR|nr:hypothetical protein [Thermogemmatispora tikiterensis]RAQ97498.1 hypothetical protein A4R35_18320 [Thermogemmatispora tikiterensis]